MNLKEAILNSATINDDLVLYARKIDGKLLPSSEVILLELTEEEMEMNTTDITNQKCPGFSYCMEMFLIKDMMKDIDWLPEKMDTDKVVERIIYYIEFDA
ncbi:hypothetical protein [Pinibacter soli]|uniref:Uncharacterized protein n=1 Tax=Pinibacter soli TaxID=3044211 RepID=A0ABT6RF32_9BACT|nr:hypothetical protein [Pinibacter soli]MDI3320462.1 hypothetical protein [Pinibacter soli]